MIYKKIPPHLLFRFMRFWPPFLGAGVKVTKASKDLRYLRVEMPLNAFNTNYVGVHFGGSLYSMVDPWYMLMFLQVLGKEYVVWDKAAEIRFRKPGKGTVSAEFIITQELIDEVKADVTAHGKTEKVIPVAIKNEAGEVVAEVKKTLWFSTKQPKA